MSSKISSYFLDFIRHIVNISRFIKRESHLYFYLDIFQYEDWKT